MHTVDNYKLDEYKIGPPAAPSTAQIQTGTITDATTGTRTVNLPFTPDLVYIYSTSAAGYGASITIAGANYMTVTTASTLTGSRATVNNPATSGAEIVNPHASYTTIVDGFKFVKDFGVNVTYKWIAIKF